MSSINYLYILLFIITINCSGNKVSNYHGIKRLESKFEKIEVNVSNKNDIISIIGPPSTISDFNKNKWYYIERLKTNQSLIKLGTQKIKKNNILIVELDEKGIVVNKKLLDLNEMNNVEYLKLVTTKEFKKDSLIYNVFSSLREKINAPLRNR